MLCLGVQYKLINQPESYGIKQRARDCVLALTNVKIEAARLLVVQVKRGLSTIGNYATTHTHYFAHRGPSPRAHVSESTF